MVMKMNARKAVGIIAVILLVLIVFSLFSNVVILAQDDTEGNNPGVDMAALWSLNGGFHWIYPGSSFDEQGRTLHNIYMLDDPYGEVDAIFKYTYNVDPHLLIIINDQAAEHIFGADLLENIRQHDWVEGNSRADAVTMSITTVNPLPIIPDILMGNIRFHII